ncbi:ThiF family adenylyltransferase [Streptomyces sp. A2-16]|uniref:HesA/MoeB/ThiF family protein n=1 Tax=Streptomyces sp. A2-16 TaxID=2781734 RepID=UPI001BAF3C9E|nr:ThiF family adenylyltransferase [Streptomyces sp. A2-16]QUC62015.1 ThiF family adenylyltransferase [Streptomyces sp. A2-16]
MTEAAAVTVEAFGRPRIKPEHRAYRTVDGNVRVGSVIHGIGAEIADPQGWVWTLVEAMDGTRGPSQVVEEVLRTHPDLTGEDAREAMADLLAAGFVDDAAATAPLPPREEDRYSRGVPLLRWMDLAPRTSPWDAQLRLREARVLLIGVGGTGGHAAQALVASGVGHLHCVDPDVVELSNLNRQPLYREPDLGHPKADTAVTTLRSLNSDVRVTGERREVRGPEDLTELVAGAGKPVAGAGEPVAGAGEPVRTPCAAGRVEDPAGRTKGPGGRTGSAPVGSAPSDRRGPVGSLGGPGRAASSSPHAPAPPPSPSSPYDLLVLAADRPEAIRRWVNRVCLAAGLPWVDAGYRGPLVTAGVYVPGRGACWECLRDGEMARRDLRLGPGQDPEVASPRMPWNPASAVTAGLSGALLAHAALALLTGAPAMEPGFRFGVNLMLPGDPVHQRTPRRPDCPACGERG